MSRTAHHAPHTTRCAFTLVELAIVLTVIGLLIGAALGGQNMLRAARVKSTVADLARYQEAAKYFKDRFKLLPGDLTNATNLWGSAGGTGSDTTCYDTSTSGSIRTCNGNGNSRIDSYGETFRFWQHLTNAQMIEGNFTGTKGSASFDHDVGSNCPATKVTNVGIGITYSASSLASATQFDVVPNNYFVVGAETAGALLTTGAFSPTEMRNIDEKSDDGAPGQGTIIAGPWTTCSNAAANTDVTTTYKLTSTSGTACWFYLINAL